MNAKLIDVWILTLLVATLVGLGLLRFGDEFRWSAPTAHEELAEFEGATEKQFTRALRTKAQFEADVRKLAEFQRGAAAKRADAQTEEQKLRELSRVILREH